MLFADAVHSFLDYLLHERRRAYNTVRQYRWALKVVHEFLCEIRSSRESAVALVELTPSALAAFHRDICTLKEGEATNYVPTSVDTLWCAAVGLFKWGVRNNLLPNVPLPQVERLPRMPSKREFVSDAEIRLLFDAVETLPERRRDLHRAVLFLWCNLGLRCCEVLKLELQDLRLDEPTVMILQTKANKSRCLAPSDECVAALRKWLASRPQTVAWRWHGEERTATNKVFCLDPSRPLGYAGLAACLQRIKVAAGMAENQRIKPHRLRHWCATNLHRSEGKGWTLEDLREFLGHSSIAITAIYLHTGEERLHALRNTQSIANLCSPLPTPPPAKGVVNIPATPAYDYDPDSGLMRVYGDDGSLAASFVLDKGLPVPTMSNKKVRHRQDLQRKK